MTTTSSFKISKANGEHYRWGENCDGWHLLRRADTSVIQERMPPGAAEARHYHRRSRQFFFILLGTATIEVAGEKLRLQRHEGVEIGPEVPHQIFNTSESDVEFLLFSTPPAQGDRVAAP